MICVNNKGFSKRESVTVLLISLILVLVLLPIFGQGIEKAKEVTDIAHIKYAMTEVYEKANHIGTVDDFNIVYNKINGYYEEIVYSNQKYAYWQTNKNQKTIDIDGVEVVGMSYAQPIEYWYVRCYTTGPKAMTVDVIAKSNVPPIVLE